tara:strand:+ start:4572 stop:4841 length:270 start_codon:yes stop_codon:yes gene_type:complete
MARACLSFLSKKDQGPLLPGRGLLVFSGGEKTMGPGKTWACLSFLSKESFPWQQELPDSRIGGGEKTACLSFLSKRAAGTLQGVLRIGK